MFDLEKGAGFALMNDGVLVVGSTSDTKEGAVIKGVLIVAGTQIIGNCITPGCDCVDLALRELAPKAKVVEVDITVREKVDG